MGDAGVRHAQADLEHGLLEAAAVLGRGDRLGVGTDELHAVLLEHAGFHQLHGEVQGRLAAERGEQGVRPLPGDDGLEHVQPEGLHVGGVGEVRVGHDRRRVGVDQDHPVAVLPQYPAGLGARVVELAGLADHDGTGADEQDALDVVTAGHQPRPPAGPTTAAIMSSNSANR